MFKILIADDSDDTRIFLRSAMTSRGWTVCGEAANGRQAVLLASQLKPDVVIMDLSMPMLTGLEATREILRGNPRQAVIMFTLHASPQLTSAAANVGARKVVSKADGLSALIAAIEEVAPAAKSSGGGRGDPGGGSHTPLRFTPFPSSTDKQTALKPAASGIPTHDDPLVAELASAPGPLHPAEPGVGDPPAAESATGPSSDAGTSGAAPVGEPPSSSQDPQT